MDECGTIEKRRDFIRLLKTEFSKLPLKFRFLITSRPEDDIMKALSPQRHILEIKLDHTSLESRRDVYTYINSEMREAVTEPVLRGWAWGDTLKVLDDAANGLFIWASTAVKMVSDSDDPLETLEDLVSDIRSVNEFGIDKLYATVLDQSGISWRNAKSRDRFTKVLELILCGKESLSDDIIDGILGYEAGKSHLTLQRLRSVLSYEPSKPIHLHHASFADYLLSSKRSRDDPWFINIDCQKQTIAARCFDVMEKLLRFNICNLETSFVLNDEVQGLQGRIKNKYRRI